MSLTNASEAAVTTVVLYHDGCKVCQSISATMTAAFSGSNHNFESVNLDEKRDRSAEAQALGIKRLPSLVINGKVMRLDDHSPIEHYV